MFHNCNPELGSQPLRYLKMSKKGKQRFVQNYIRVMLAFCSS